MRELLIILKAISNPVRLRIMKLLENDELCVCYIVKAIGLKQPTISKHLNILKNAGLVRDRKEGLWVYYKLSKENINKYNIVTNNFLTKCLNDDQFILNDKKRLNNIKCCN